MSDYREHIALVKVLKENVLDETDGNTYLIKHTKPIRYSSGCLNLNNQYKAQISSEAWSPMNPAVLESDIVQNPKNIIWPYGHSIGIDSTGELRNYMQINNY